MRVTVLFTVMLLSIGVANAGPTYHWQEGAAMDHANYASDPPIVSWFLEGSGVTADFYAGNWLRGYWQNWCWDHAVTYPGDPSPDGSGVFTILSATLTVRAWNVSDDDPTLITADGHLLGPLQTQPPGLGPLWTMTTFDWETIVSNFDDLLDGELDVCMAIDVDQTGNRIIVDWAQLDVSYRWDWVEYPVVPVPGAVALAGIGTCLVGWIRRRRYL